MGYRPNNGWRNKFRGADSKWEGELKEGVLQNCKHHPDKVSYTIEHTYTPDFIHEDILIEAKGRFMDAAESRKYLWIRKALKPGQELVFLFYRHSTPMPNAKARKDGTKFTHGEWATKNNFRWFTEDTITKILK